MKYSHWIVVPTVTLAVLIASGACGNGDEFLTAATAGNAPSYCVPCSGICCESIPPGLDCCLATVCGPDGAYGDEGSSSVDDGDDGQGGSCDPTLPPPMHSM